MGWEVGFDHNWKRDIGYGVPSFCDHTDCSVEIDRGLSHVCGSRPYGGDHGCGLYFCDSHLTFHEVDNELVQLCERCAANYFTEQPIVMEPFIPKPDTPEWINHKATDPSWEKWRASLSTIPREGN